MENIIKLVTEKTGLSNEQAKSAVETVLGLVKDKLPASVGDQLNALLEGKEFDYNAVLKGQLENLKGEASEKMEHLKDEAAEKIEDLKEDAQNLFKKLF